jgi:hypothetical protein
MGSDTVTAVANSLHRHDQSNGFGTYDLDTVWRTDWNEASLRHAGSTSDVVFVEEHSLRLVAVRLQKIGVNITHQTLWENVRTNELFTNGTTKHVYGKSMLVVAFNSFMCIITIP